MRRCERCGEGFKATGAKQRYCGLSCAAIANGARRDICEMTMRLKVREAKLDQSLRDFFEQVGEQIVGLALAIEATRGNGNHVTQIAPPQAMNVIYEHQDEAAQWLIERRDLAERRETLTMLVRAAFLVFLLVTVLLTFGRPP
jgi:hypothetical protein